MKAPDGFLFLIPADQTTPCLHLCFRCVGQLIMFYQQFLKQSKMYICSFPIMHVGKYVIEKNRSCLKKHNYLAGQKWPVTSRVVRISLQLFFFLQYTISETVFLYSAIERCIVAAKCYSSKRHKFVNFRFNFDYFVLKIKSESKTSNYLVFH